MTDTLQHIPVLLDAVKKYMAPQSGDTLMDLTVGAAGHFQALLDIVGPTGHMIGFDRDHDTYQQLKKRYDSHKNVSLYHRSWLEVVDALPPELWSQITGVLIDCGVSSMQLDQGHRGFSFQADAPLDMRMDQTQGATAKDLIESLSQDELADVLYQYADEHRSRRIAKVIKERQHQQKMSTTHDLAQAVETATGPRRGSRIHPATKTFQALRIKVNEEMKQIEGVLDHLIKHLQPGARILVITFHSLEDRCVKNLFREAAQAKKIRLLHKKVVQATREEVLQNKRSRSAKLRSVEVVAQ
jgi:16S rRNA (cytosine1402-N4)-methyltransferase